MTERVGYRGYVTSRPFGGLHIPVPVQALVLRDYCARNGYLYKLHANENVFPNSYMVLEGMIHELDRYEGLLGDEHVHDAEAPRTSAAHLRGGFKPGCVVALRSRGHGCAQVVGCRADRGDPVDPQPAAGMLPRPYPSRFRHQKSAIGEDAAPDAMSERGARVTVGGWRPIKRQPVQPVKSFGLRLMIDVGRACNGVADVVSVRTIAAEMDS